MNESLTDLHIF